MSYYSSITKMTTHPTRYHFVEIPNSINRWQVQETWDDNWEMYRESSPRRFVRGISPDRARYVSVPPNLNMGLVIGKEGKQFNWITKTSGLASLWFDRNTNNIVLMAEGFNR